jgi:hypothetical protein
MRKSAKNIINRLQVRVARLEARMIKSKGLKGFLSYLIKAIGSEPEGDLKSYLMKMKAVIDSKQEQEVFNLGSSIKWLTLSIEHIDNVLATYERSSLVMQSQVREYKRTQNQTSSMTVIYDPMLESQVVLNEVIRTPKKTLEETKVVLQAELDKLIALKNA